MYDQVGGGVVALGCVVAFKAALERLAGVDVARRLDRLGGDKLLEHPITQLIDGPRWTPGCMPPGGRGEWRATLPHTQLGRLGPAGTGRGARASSGPCRICWAARLPPHVRRRKDK